MKLRSISKRKIVCMAVLVAFSLSIMGTGTGVAAETPEAQYSGIGNADVMLGNLDYSDVKTSAEWVKDAVYETGALNLVKGYGSKSFGLSTVVSKERALSYIYTAIGREAEAQQLAENLNSARAEEDKKKDPLSMWSDGFLQLALNDGLITQQNFTDAMELDQASLEQGSFMRNGSATRQEVAAWVAKALKLQPIYDQKNLFNNFRDWKSADSASIPYIEAILQNNIMTGDANGNFRPLNTVNRGQIAQIIRNAEEFILPLSGLDRKTGTVEDIVTEGDYSQQTPVTQKTFDVRNSNGSLHTVSVRYPANGAGGKRDETNGNALPGGQRELLVFKNGTLGKSSLLKAGDRIEYITALDNTVRYVKVLSSIYDTKYYVAKVNKVDNTKRSINAAVFIRLEYPDIDLSKTNMTFDLGSENAIVNYTYSSNVSVFQGKAKSDMKVIVPETYVILTVKNNMVTEIKTLDMEAEGENNVVQGIVEDNNPQLGYISLYNEDGTGVSSDSKQSMYALRTFNIGNQNTLEVFKNHKEASIEDIEVGDTVFLKLDSNGNVESVSAADNYTVRYGKIIARNATTLSVRYDNGTQQILDMDKNVLVLENKRLISYNTLKNGDNVRLLLNANNKATTVKEISKEGGQSLISNIYKGSIDKVNKTSNKLVVNNLQQLYNGQWVRKEEKGLAEIPLAEGYSMYFDNKTIDRDRADKYLKANEAYIAVQKDYGGQEKAIVISYRNQEDAEDIPYEDSITYALPGSGEFSISKKQEKIKNGDGTIIIKDGRLVSSNSILAGDTAYVVANRAYGTGDYEAGVVQISSKSPIGGLKLYRARISKIDEMKSFTVESFSQLNDLNWSYFNTPKTFSIIQNTRIIDDGVVSQRDFKDYGTDSYGSRTVYVLADDVNALLVTTAPYGTINTKGEVFETTGATFGDEEGELLTEPTGISLINTKTYDLSRLLWVESKDMTLNILSGTIILKDGKVIKPSDIKKGDTIRVIKKDYAETGDAYIIIVG